MVGRRLDVHGVLNAFPYGFGHKRSAQIKDYGWAPKKQCIAQYSVSI